MKPKLDRWIIFGNCLVGYIYDSHEHSSGQRVQTDAVRFVDTQNFEAECLDGSYKLGEPGTHAEHNQPLIGSRPDAPLPEVDKRIFLNPRG